MLLHTAVCAINTPKRYKCNYRQLSNAVVLDSRLLMPGFPANTPPIEDRSLRIEVIGILGVKEQISAHVKEKAGAGFKP
jgi:hypothetical protein